MEFKLPDHLFVGPIEHVLKSEKAPEGLDSIDIELDEIHDELFQILCCTDEEVCESNFEFCSNDTGTNFLSNTADLLKLLTKAYNLLNKEQPGYIDTELLNLDPLSAFEVLRQIENDEIDYQLDNEFLKEFPKYIRDSINLLYKLSIFIICNNDEIDNDKLDVRVTKLLNLYSRIQSHFDRKFLFRTAEKGLFDLFDKYSDDDELQNLFLEQYGPYILNFFNESGFELSIGDEIFKRILQSELLAKFFFFKCLSKDFVRPYTKRKNLIKFVRNYLTLMYNKRRSELTNEQEINSLHDCYMDLTTNLSNYICSKVKN
ncbi:hypothetical protein GF354_05335 [Candidatus Peregrinibacteria bacterium]|nr:hypothetical protein [Candidatus Peregrinibacteria bacterium]